MFSVNQEAVRIVKEKIIPNAEMLQCEIHHLKNGATVIDMGLDARGGYMAGKLFVEATLGGMGYVDFGRFTLGEIDLPSIDVYIDQPQTATLSSQFSGWNLTEGYEKGEITPVGSGPARAIYKDFGSIGWPYQDNHHETVFAAQTTEMPDEAMAADVAEKCGISPKNVYILATITGSLAGSIQVCSRSVETSTFCMFKKGFPLEAVISGMGVSPIPPPTSDELSAMDRVNTALMYGAIVRYLVDCEDSDIEAFLKLAPFNVSPRFGEHFSDLFEEGNRNFNEVDKSIHTVACYEITNFRTGRTFRAGEFREDLLAKSFF
ncbi:MAG TPA: methenyltetrahydromethanopterin cyclohydrolase [Oscillospiraceae bacterium]|nr:methenyltetrahydromethanopterin cyclohydrolase [Oscillospiraceae bacterium]